MQLQSYLATKGHVIQFANGPYKNQEERMAHFKTFFDEYDFLSDDERKDSLIVYTNEKAISQKKAFAPLSKHFKGQRTPENMLKAAMKADFWMATHDVYTPMEDVEPNFAGTNRPAKNSRSRGFGIAGTNIQLRIELSRDRFFNRYMRHPTVSPLGPSPPSVVSPSLPPQE